MLAPMLNQSPFQMPAIEKSTTEDKTELEDNAQTIRPHRSPSSQPLALKPRSPNMGPILEDYSDLAGEEEEGNLQAKVADFKVCGVDSTKILPYQPQSSSRTRFERDFSTPMILKLLGFPTPSQLHCPLRSYLLSDQNRRALACRRSPRAADLHQILALHPFRAPLVDPKRIGLSANPSSIGTQKTKKKTMRTFLANRTEVVSSSVRSA